MEQHFQLDPFNDAVDCSGLRREWEEWHRSCEIVLELKQLKSQHEKLLFMLARGGRGLQRIYYNLAPVVGEVYPDPPRPPMAPQEIPEYDNAVKRLNVFFIGKRNERVELEIFRSLIQKIGEPFNRYMLRLRTQAGSCDFGDREEKEILQQITMGASDERVRDKGLEGVMDLNSLINYAVNREVLVKQKEKNLPFKEGTSALAVNYTAEKKTAPRWNDQRGQKWSAGYRSSQDCSRCGSWRHQAKDCPARNSRCNTCKQLGHFARKCTAGRNTMRAIHSTGRFRWQKPEVANVLQNDVLDAEVGGSGYRREYTEKVE